MGTLDRPETRASVVIMRGGIGLGEARFLSDKSCSKLKVMQ